MAVALQILASGFAAGAVYRTASRPRPVAAVATVAHGRSWVTTPATVAALAVAAVLALVVWARS